MTLEQLRVFVAVAERQHVTRAAEALNIAQSAVSASIAALEGRHGAKLFHRVGRRIELTEAGAPFLAEAHAVLARAESAELVLRIGEAKARRPVCLSGVSTIETDLRFSGREDFWIIVAARSEDETEIPGRKSSRRKTRSGKFGARPVDTFQLKRRSASSWKGCAGGEHSRGHCHINRFYWSVLTHWQRSVSIKSMGLLNASRRGSAGLYLLDVKMP